MCYTEKQGTTKLVLLHTLPQRPSQTLTQSHCLEVIKSDRADDSQYIQAKLYIWSGTQLLLNQIMHAYKKGIWLFQIEIKIVIMS